MDASKGDLTTVSAWPFVLSVFALSRVFFLVVGAVAVVLLPGADPAGDPLNPPGFLSYWANWDGGWYSLIATEGYGVRAPESTAFFPLYPNLLGLGTKLGLGAAVWGMLLSLGFALLALYFLYAIAEKLFDARTARYATVALAFFPTAFYLNSVYTEAPFLAFTAGCFWAVYVRQNFLLAGIFGLLAATTRNLGVLMVVPLFFEWWRVREGFGRRDILNFLCIGLVPAGLLGYMAYLWGRFGDPLLFAKQQGDYWGRTLTSPAVTAQAAWDAASEGSAYLMNPGALFAGPSVGPSFEVSNTVSLLFMGFLLIVIGVGAALLPPGLTLFTALVVLLPVLTPSPSFPLMSMPRFALGTFPVFLVLGFLLARGGKFSLVWFAGSVVLGVGLTALFVSWRWVA
ncbi:MAG: hypothetical protein ACR2KW_00930 [Rubrobacter sp.]